MRHIRKGKEPLALTRYRAAPGARYDGDSGFPVVKEAIREGLVHEQHALCCYCMQRIKPSDPHMRIEHRVPQSDPRGRDLDLDWRNLLGACPGGEDSQDTHCDVAKGGTPITLDPTESAHAATLSFRAGRIQSSNRVFQVEIDDVLKLNCAQLVERREHALDAYIRERTAGRMTGLRREVFERWLRQIEDVPTGHPLPPFSELLVSWLRKEIRRRSSKL